MFDDHSATAMNGVIVPLQQARLVLPAAPPGALAIQLAVVDGHVIVDFCQPIQWMALTPEQAGKLSADLEVAVRYARTLHREVDPDGPV